MNQLDYIIRNKTDYFHSSVLTQNNSSEEKDFIKAYVHDLDSMLRSNNEPGDRDYFDLESNAAMNFYNENYEAFQISDNFGRFPKDVKRVRLDLSTREQNIEKLISDKVFPKSSFLKEMKKKSHSEFFFSDHTVYNVNLDQLAIIHMVYNQSRGYLSCSCKWFYNLGHLFHSLYQNKWITQGHISTRSFCCFSDAITFDDLEDEVSIISKDPVNCLYLLSPRDVSSTEVMKIMTEVHLGIKMRDHFISIARTAKTIADLISRDKNSAPPVQTYSPNFNLNWF